MEDKPKLHFVRTDEIQQSKEENKPEEKEQSVSEVQKAKDTAEVKKHESEAKEYEMKAKFSEANIKSADDLLAKHKQVDDRLSELNQAFESFDAQRKEWGRKTQAIIKKLEVNKVEWEREKANEQAGIEAKKTALDKHESELNNREQNIDALQQNVDAAWVEVKEIRTSLNAEQLKKLEQEKENKKLINRLQNGIYEQYSKLMNSCLDVLWRCGFKKLVSGIDSDLKIMGKWVGNELPEHFDELVELMREQVEVVNKKASFMARNQNDYSPSSWNSIVDNVEGIVKLIPEIKPNGWVDGEE